MSATLLAVVAAFAVMTWLILQSVIAPTFDDLEAKAAATDLVRAERAMQSDLENLEAVTADWAPWDDIYYYVRGQNPGFRYSNLDRPTLTNLGLDFMAVFALEGELMWGRAIVDQEITTIDVLGILDRGNPGSERLIEHGTDTSRTAGIVQTNAGPAIISSRPILRSDDSGPVSGAIVMGQFLNDERLHRLRERTEVGVSWLFTDDPAAAASLAALDDLAMGQIRMDVSENTLSSFKVFPDIFGQPLLIVQTDTPRNISALGEQAVNAGLLFICVVGILIIVLIWFLLQRSILSPLDKLAGHMNWIRQSGDLTHRSGLDSGDEIGALATQFDSLTRDVYNARRALLDQSFKAGKADTAAEVLHNIRNAMTPMINGLERLAKSLRLPGDLRIEEALAQLGEPGCPDERRDKLHRYIDASFKHISDTGHEAGEDLNIVMSQARQIEAILTDQEKFASAAPVAENVPVSDVVREATHVLPKDASPDVDVEIDSAVGSYRVRAHRIGLLQVLGNLILNAFESIQREAGQKGEIRLSAERAMLDDTPMVRLTVRDNGRGFNKDVGARIFQRGFTSKKEGEYKGLGLHWCANAVASMGGRIVAESPGEGQGAEFHVLLPAAQGG